MQYITEHVLGKNIDRVLISEVEIDSAVRRIAEEIDNFSRQSGKNLLLLGILKGSVVFMGDLMKRIKTPVEIDFMKVSSYGSGAVSSGRINIILDLARKNLQDTDIVIIEDIIDSGRTLSYLVDYMKFNGAN